MIQTYQRQKIAASLIVLGPHAFFIVTAYAVSAVVIGVVIAWIIADHRAQRRDLAELEIRGVMRRSQIQPEDTP
jgi:heme exporter protein D